MAFFGCDKRVEERDLMFDSVLIANRGEIAVRVIRTLRRLGIRSVAVFSDADAKARHVIEADLAMHIGAAPPRESYLRTERLIEAACTTGVQAVHPGYGFLSENPAFARACAEADLVFVGPPVNAIEVMGDKIRAKQTVGRAGVPVVPGRAEAGMTDRQLCDAAIEVGFPILIKPSAGGGGKGMHVVASPDALADAIVRARREASTSFGDDTLFLERFVSRPRHIEVQVMADTSGRTIHLGERECSLQRRHQKIIEEAPSALLDLEARSRIGDFACTTAQAVGYVGAGTVEFIVGADQPDDFFFMEMNTRLQVEHPVTEEVFGLDLVELQLRVASGEPLGIDQSDVRINRHAIEARIYAEDPGRGFLPTGGRALVVREPDGQGVRVDSALVEGLEIGTTYDPMLAKVIASGPDRATAMARLDRALAKTVLLGFATNVSFLRALLAHPDVREGKIDTELVDRDLELLTAHTPPNVAYVAYGLVRLASVWPQQSVVDPWDIPSGWTVVGPRPIRLQVDVPNEKPVVVTVCGSPGEARVRVDDGLELQARLTSCGNQWLLEVAGITHDLVTAPVGRSMWVAIDGGSWLMTEALPRERRSAEDAVADIQSPMPGTVISVAVSSGDAVAAGQAILVVEAMKMEHTLTAPGPGHVELLVRQGEQVSLDQLLARITPAGSDSVDADGT